MRTNNNRLMIGKTNDNRNNNKIKENKNMSNTDIGIDSNIINKTGL